MRFKDFFKGITPLLKLALTLLAFQVILSMFGMSLLLLDGRRALQVVLFVLFFGALGAFMYVLGSSAAYTDYNMLKNNGLRKKNGETVPLYRTYSEYRWYKGAVAGLLSVLPLIMLVVLYAIFPQQNGFSVAARLCYFIYYAPVELVGGNATYAMLYTAPLAAIVPGITYVLRARKLHIQYLEHTHRTEGR